MIEEKKEEDNSLLWILLILLLLLICGSNSGTGGPSDGSGGGNEGSGTPGPGDHDWYTFDEDIEEARDYPVAEVPQTLEYDLSIFATDEEEVRSLLLNWRTLNRSINVASPLNILIRDDEDMNHTSVHKRVIATLSLSGKDLILSPVQFHVLFYLGFPIRVDDESLRWMSYAALSSELGPRTLEGFFSDVGASSSLVREVPGEFYTLIAADPLVVRTAVALSEDSNQYGGSVDVAGKVTILTFTGPISPVFGRLGSLEAPSVRYVSVNSETGVSSVTGYGGEPYTRSAEMLASVRDDVNRVIFRTAGHSKAKVITELESRFGPLPDPVDEITYI